MAIHWSPCAASSKRIQLPLLSELNSLYLSATLAASTTLLTNTIRGAGQTFSFPPVGGIQNWLEPVLTPSYGRVT
jgi:hypothetical protein